MIHTKDSAKVPVADTGENLGVADSSSALRTISATFTPHWLAYDMAGLCGIRYHHTILEPSAGLGMLAQAAALTAVKENIQCIELNAGFCRELRMLGFPTFHADFLHRAATPTYDRILMNPPSHDDRYVDHVLHAIDFLRHDGRLVALIVDRFMKMGATRHEIKFRQAIRHVGRLYKIVFPRFTIENRIVEAALLVVNK